MSTPATEDLSRRQQLVRTYKMTKESDPRIGLILLGTFVVGALVGFGLFWLLPGPTWLFPVIGALLFGFTAVMAVFGRRAQTAAYAQMHGRTGSAAAVLNVLKRGWKVDPAVGFTKQQDVVHRVVGPPGIVLVGEGNGSRLKGLLTNERRKHERVLVDTPVYEVICGDGPDEVPLEKLVKHVRKLGRNVEPAAQTDILNRLKALDAQRSNIPMPKGPMPTSMKGYRGNLRGR